MHNPNMEREPLQTGNDVSNSSQASLVPKDASFYDSLSPHHHNNVTNSSSLHSEPRWLLLGLTAITAWIIFGNLMVLLAVRYHRSLRSLSNYVIASLALTDFLLAAIVTPLGIYQVVHGEWALGLYACIIWTGSDVFLSTTSIMHLAAIAIHRYFGISYPLRVRSVGDIRHVACLLAPAWSISLAISIPLIVQGVRNPIDHVFIKINEERYKCGIFDRTFAIYSSLVSFFIPLTIMIFADIRSVQILRKNVKISSNQNNNPSANQSSSNSFNSNNSHTNHNNCNHFNESANRLSSSKDPSVYEMASSEAHTAFIPQPPMETRLDFRAHSVNRSVSNSSDTIEESYMPFSPQSTPTSERDCRVFSPPNTPNNERLSKLRKKRSHTKTIGYIGMLSGRGLVKINSRERRAEKTLIWVFVCFVVFWLPFFTTNLTYGLCKSCTIPDELFLAFTWLGYIASGVNPCIYTMLNRDFRNAFKRLLLCRFTKSSRKLNSAVTSALYA